MPNRYDTIIIGAGLSGLAAGIRLAQFQDRVCIVESHTRAGGLNSYYTRQGVTISAGLHTMTNADASNRKWGAGLLARSLGVPFADFKLAPPTRPSRIRLGQASLMFDADAAVLRDSIAKQFPKQIEGYDKLVAYIRSRPRDPAWFGFDAAEVLREYIPQERLVELLLLPVLCYGGYRRNIDFGTFAVVFRSFFLDGFGAPPSMAHVVEMLVERFRALGGELLLGTTVAEIEVEDERARGVHTQAGARLEAETILSSAGMAETALLAGRHRDDSERVSAFELVLGYDRPLRELGVEHTLAFDCDHDTLPDHFEDNPAVRLVAGVDLYDHPSAAPHQIKISRFSSSQTWAEEPPYAVRKAQIAQALEKELHTLYPLLNAGHVMLRDCFTPQTVARYTGHPDGAIYGGQRKAFDGASGLDKLYLIGNDQGGIGIMGAMISGVVIANQRVILAG